MQLLHWSLCCQLSIRGHCPAELGLASAWDTGSRTLELLLSLVTPGSHPGTLCPDGGGTAAPGPGGHPLCRPIGDRELPLALKDLPAFELGGGSGGALRLGWDHAPVEGRQPSPSKLLPKRWPGGGFWGVTVTLDLHLEA